jgi:hypothetical protein
MQVVQYSALTSVQAILTPNFLRRITWVADHYRISLPKLFTLHVVGYEFFDYGSEPLSRPWNYNISHDPAMRRSLLLAIHKLIKDAHLPSQPQEK